MKINDEQYKFIIDGEDYHCALDNTKRRFSELKEVIPDITDKMLSLQLRALEDDGLVKRTIFPEVPPRVEYELTKEGQSLLPVLEAMAAWGRAKARKDGKMVKVERAINR